jgi:hypothetical protein
MSGTVHRMLVALTLLAFACGTAGAAQDASDNARWKPIWDGKSLNGWHKIGSGEWKIENGVLIGAHPNEKDQEFGHLVSDKQYKDFTVRVVFNAVKGNSGFYFHIAKAGFSGVTGFQAEIDATKDVGGIYETNGRAWVSQPKPEDIKKFFKPQDWNEMIVSAHGPYYVVKVNGTTVVDIKDDKGRKEGHFALQVHGSQYVQVMFKSIDILDEGK